MPQQRHNHPVLMNAKVDRIREGLGEDATELRVNFAVRSGKTDNLPQLSAERCQISVAQLAPAFFVIPRRRFISVFPSFREDAKLFHPRLAFTKASNCSSVSARKGSRSNRAQRESSSRFSASLTSSSSLASPMDCQSTSTMSSFSLTGSACNLRTSAGFMMHLSKPPAFSQPRSHSPFAS